MPKGIYTRKPRPLAQRFWASVDMSGGPDACWPWMKVYYPNGYGLFAYRDDNGKQHSTTASNMAFSLTHGPLLKGFYACHNCPGGDNPACCNPSHLFSGTATDNMQDAKRKGRMPSGERHYSHTHPERTPRGDRSGYRRHPENYPKGDAHWTRQFPERVVRGDNSSSRQHPERLPHGDDHWCRKHPEQIPVGEQRYNAKLTEDTVRQIRANQSLLTQEELAKMFGVSRRTIGKILARQTWKHIS